MNKLVKLLPGQRGLTTEGEQAFEVAYLSSCILESDFKPVIRFPKRAADIIRKIAELRKKEWRSTSRWNQAADETGLLGELAAQRYLGISPEEALTDFLQGLHGDHGHDVEVDALKLDVKASRGSALRFKFSKTNRYANLADGFLFAHVEELGSEVWVNLLGWSYRVDTKPYMRDDGQRLFVRAETLRREGVLRPVSILKKLKDPDVINPLHTIY